MDKLDKLFEHQKGLDEYICAKRGLKYSAQEWIQKRALALIEELTEVLNEVNYKWWKTPKPVNSAALKEELVDVLHFYLGMCIDAGLSANELYEIYINKNRENFDRQNGVSKKQGYGINN